VNLKVTGNLRPHTHFEVKRINNAQFNHIQVHQRVVTILDESRLEGMHAADLVIPVDNDVSQGGII